MVLVFQFRGQNFPLDGVQHSFLQASQISQKSDLDSNIF